MLTRILLAISAMLCLGPTAEAQIFGAILPQARSTVVNGTVTAFATMINSGSTPATNCRIVGAASVWTFSYQTTNAQNVPTGTPNTPVTIPANSSQGFIISYQPNQALSFLAFPAFACDGQQATHLFWVNDMIINADATQAADVIPIALTPTNDGVIRIAAPGGLEAMATAAVNIGPTTQLAVIPIAAFTPDTTLNNRSAPITLTAVETNPTNGQPLGTPSAGFVTTFTQNTPKTFAVFAQAPSYGGLPLQPGDLRVFLVFVDQANKVRGLTSAAITAPAPANSGTLPAGVWDGVLRNSLNETKYGYFFVAPDGRASWLTHSFSNVTGTSVTWSADIAAGQLTVNSGASTYSGTGVTVNEAGTTGGFAVSGSYTPASGFIGSYTAPGETGAFSAFYSNANQFTPALAELAGSYDVQDPTAPSAADVAAGTITVSATGTITGTTSGCPVNGTLTKIASARNLFSIDYTFTLGGAGCAFPPGSPTHYTGLGARLGTLNPFPFNFGLPSRDYFLIYAQDDTHSDVTAAFFAKK